MKYCVLFSFLFLNGCGWIASNPKVVESVIEESADLLEDLLIDDHQPKIKP